MFRRVVVVVLCGEKCKLQTRRLLVFAKLVFAELVFDGYTAHNHRPNEFGTSMSFRVKLYYESPRANKSRGIRAKFAHLGERRSYQAEAIEREAAAFGRGYELICWSGLCD